MNFPYAPVQGSNFASEHDAIFYALLLLTILFTAIIYIAVIYFAVKYRRGTKVDRSRPVEEHLKLELTWTIIPLVLGVIMFFFGAELFVKERIPPKDAIDIFVIGKQWMWHFEHANGVRENNTLHVPVGKAVRLTMISQDVLHAFYVPEFRVQYHVVPGRYVTTWFTPTKAGTFRIECGMYCGTQHSEMVGHVISMPAAEYAAWLNNGGNDVVPMTMEQRGAKIYAKLACANCHTDQDTERAPTLYGLYGKTRRFTDGASVVADDGYVRESILRPHDRVTAGYADTMPIYQGQIEEMDVLDLQAYIKSLGTSGPAKPTASGGPEKGVAPTNTAPIQSVGALQSQDPQRVANSKGTLSVGAIAAEGRR